jgi:hypothetical protein
LWPCHLPALGRRHLVKMPRNSQGHLHHVEPCNWWPVIPVFPPLTFRAFPFFF